MDPIRIFIGCAANHEDAESQVVLEYTLREHTSQPLDITWMMQSRDPLSPYYSEGPAGWQTQKWATPFSGFRWAIPAICNFEGKAIYLDSDIIVLADIAELWNTPFHEGKTVIAKGGNRYCCSLWDCSAQPHRELMALMVDPDAHLKVTNYWSRSSAVQHFENGDWNYLDLERPRPFDSPKIKAIHYTRMDQQLQLKYAIPRLAAQGRRHWFNGQVRPNDWPGLQGLFDTMLAEALAAGYSVAQYTKSPLFGKYRIRGG